MSFLVEVDCSGFTPSPISLKLSLQVRLWLDVTSHAILANWLLNKMPNIGLHDFNQVNLTKTSLKRRYSPYKSFIFEFQGKKLGKIARET